MDQIKIASEVYEESASDGTLPKIKAYRAERDVERASWPGLHPDTSTGGSNASTPAAGGRASFMAQAGALWRKNAVYQRRNVGTNACLLCAPILFCLLLLVVQVAVTKLLLTGENYQCGCQCTRCCYKGDEDNCTLQTMGPCPYDCLERNNSNCGVRYSSTTQYAFCDLTHPSSWPSILQTPPEPERAAPFRPKASLLFTGDDEEAALALSTGMLPAPTLTATTLLQAEHYLEAFAADLKQQPGGLTVPGELLSLLGVRLGTSSAVKAGLYLETALMGDAPTLYTLWPDGTCADLGLDGQVNISLTTMLKAMVDSSNTPAVAAVLNKRLDSLDEALAENSSTASAAAQVTSLKMNCTDVVLSMVGDAEVLQQALYCGYYQGRCNGSTGPNAYAAALNWRSTSAMSFQPDLFINDTWGVAADDTASGKTIYQRVPEVLNLAVNSWLKTALGDNYTAELIALMDAPKLPSFISLDLSSLLGPLCCTWVVQMLLPVFLMQLVYEKEKRLRMMIKMHGLGDTAYWLVMYSWFLLLYVAYMCVFVFFGSIIGLNIFTQNNYGIQFVLFFLFGNNMIATAFLLSCCFTRSKTATVFAYLVVFGTGLIGVLLLSQLVNAGRWYAVLLEIIPSLALYRGLYEMGEYASLAVYRNSFGMGVANLYDPDNGMLHSWIILAGEWLPLMVLAWYLEQVFASGTGNPRPPLFFLDWARKITSSQEAVTVRRTQRRSSDLKLPTIKTAIKPPPAAAKPNRTAAAAGSFVSALGAVKGSPLPVVSASPAVDQEPPDVAAERMRVQRLPDCANHPIVLQQLHKTYPSRDGQQPKVAVRALNLGIQKGECFGLLGPNGAGKSTSISMMVGLLEPTAGTALIGGYDITKDMDAIYSLMGVCPQHDLLWETLTGREHLLFYGRLKGLTGAELEASVESSLRSVNLWNNGVADKQARQYSGGMKRRLSVAISFTGNPLVVYLDEPSTGLDPASRRNLWDVVKSNKRDRAIVLTTHSMEEAELLCDRLGIFVDGRLVCIGHPKEITSRYASFLVLSIAVLVQQVAAAQEVVLAMSPHAQLTYSVGGTLKFELPTSEVSLSRVFATMTGSKVSGLELLDWGVANATLEEVFIRFARGMGVKAGR